MASWLLQLLYWGGLPVEAAVALIFVKRRLYRQFFFFFLFVAVTVVSTAIRLGVYVFHADSSRPYFYAYWISDLIETISKFLAMYELLFRRLFPGFYRVAFYRYLCAVGAAVIFTLGWLSALVAPNSAAAFLIEARVVNLVTTSVLILLVCLMLFMGRIWSRFEFAIAVGFGLNAAAFLIVSAMYVRSKYHPTVANILPVIAWDVACVLWFATFWKPEEVDSALSLPASSDLVRDAKQLQDDLRNLVKQKRHSR